jgi:hypothetical protein
MNSKDESSTSGHASEAPRRLVLITKLAEDVKIRRDILAEWIARGSLPRPIQVGMRARARRDGTPWRTDGASERPLAQGYLEGAELDAVRARVMNEKQRRNSRPKEEGS